jgi:hypothetical protein
VRDALGYALRFTRSGKSHRHASEMVARIAVDVLLEQLERGGFVVVNKPERPTLDQVLKQVTIHMKDCVGDCSVHAYVGEVATSN